jgi:hypothetical protein
MQLRLQRTFGNVTLRTETKPEKNDHFLVDNGSDKLNNSRQRLEKREKE